ncbi:hypothetical protein [Nocardia pseudovaccinii]|uniref:hypothetical protein n=1 Tax=Nocardia pseudovaccinii TaxID=189540 RepID=UPI0007A4B18A|nr:hypothetical protein [Nocardia pseudovaccinii]
MSDNAVPLGRPAAEHLIKTASDIARLLSEAGALASAADHATAQQNQAVLGSLATANALLAVEGRLGELVEQLRVGNVIAAFGTDGEDGLLAIDDQASAATYVRAHVGEIVDPNGGE